MLANPSHPWFNDNDLFVICGRVAFSLASCFLSDFGMRWMLFAKLVLLDMSVCLHGCVVESSTWIIRISSKVSLQRVCNNSNRHG